MNLRWLLGNFTDPQYKLSRAEQFRLSRIAHERYLSRKTLLLRTALLVIPLLVFLAVFKPVLAALGYAGQTVPFLVAMGLIMFWGWPVSAWMYRSIYVKPVRMAMRDAGFNLCIECGYDLTGLPHPTPNSATDAPAADITASARCPECGALRPHDPKA